MRNTTLLNTGWQFCLTSVDQETPGDSFAPVELPHDWLIYDTNDLYKTSSGWYKRSLEVPQDGKRTLLRFEGVYMDCRIYVNGVQAGEWKYGYTTFDVDITSFLKNGENEIIVRVDHREPNSRWYSGAGIYRNVWLIRTEQTYLLQDGVYVSADTDGSVIVTTEAARPAGVPTDGLSVQATVSRVTEDICLVETESPMLPLCAADRSVLPPTVTRDGLSYSVNDIRLKINDPALWDITSPNLYQVSVTLFENGEPIDSLSTRFGFKKAEFTPDKGFFLNGRHLKLHGCCEHHDLGALGAAVNKAAIRRKLRKLRKIGINAIRTSHNPPAVEFLDLADEMGFLVLDEAFDMWELKKTEYDYARFFPDWVERDVASWVRRDRSRACLIGWSIGNEIYDTHASDRGQEITSMLARQVRLHDPRGNGAVTIGSNYMGSENAQKCADILKVAGYNYAERLYDEHHAAHPDWCIYGSETSSVVQSRGIYHFPLSQSIVSEDDLQCSALGNSAPAWAARNYEACIIPDRDAEFCAGQFIWTGFDYIGEPTPYSTKNSYFGQIDTAGFYKDSAFVFRSAWTDYRTDPFIHIFPYWDHNEGELIDVRAATNAPRAAIFFNGDKVAEETFDREHGKKLTLDTVIPYSKGEITAVAYDENGNEIARDSQRSFGDTASLLAEPDKTTLTPDGKDLVFIEISALDKEGNLVANANDRVTVSVEGEGRLVGLDNGDSTDYDQYKGTSRRLFSGRLLAIIASKKTAGDIRVTLSSPGLPDTVLSLSSEPCGPFDRELFLAENTPQPCECKNAENDVPVRRIDIKGESKRFDPDHRILSFGIAPLPARSCYAEEIEYRIANVSGIDSNLARIVSSDSRSVTVEALGDGEFFLRAACRNGTENIHIISSVRLEAQGLGSPTTDPYQLVLGGLYTISGGSVSNGIKHGAAFGNGGGWFGFERVDFGTVGSDEITLPLFANYSTPVRIRVYDGTPENGELLGDFEYSLSPVWLTYQPMTYKLNKTLRGEHSISIASDIHYDVQGFSFTKRPKETAEMPAVAALAVYGDSFKINENDITDIGNNVILDFGSYDFTEFVPKKLVMKGRSELPVNTVHLLFKTEDGGERRVSVEFEKAESYTERAFEISGISGKGEVSFCFLPGSKFDFESFRFE
ncbi:MAG: DUF4982 domain-containing protein [Ruminococcus sp.]|nr:DUF4982 domain-containing protein [Ruminococcus sp.]